MKTENILSSMIRWPLLFLLFTAFSAQAQEIIPQNYSLKTKEDYQRYEPNVRKGIQWLIETSRSENPVQRTHVEEFLIKWIKGTPYLTVVIEPYVMKLAKKNPDLLLTFIFGYAIYQLEHPDNKALLNPNLAGVERLLQDYQMNLTSLKKDEKIEEVLALQEKEEISLWVKQQLTQSELQN